MKCMNQEFMQERKKQKMANAANEGNTNVVVGWWNEFSRFLSDVRGELRKVVAPTRKEVEATTTVVVIAVLLFGVFFCLRQCLLHRFEGADRQALRIALSQGRTLDRLNNAVQAECEK